MATLLCERLGGLRFYISQVSGCVDMLILGRNSLQVAVSFLLRRFFVCGVEYLYLNLLIYKVSDCFVVIGNRNHRPQKSRCRASAFCSTAWIVQPAYTLKRKCITSPSLTTYSLPSRRHLPASLAPASPLNWMKSL